MCLFGLCVTIPSLVVEYARWVDEHLFLIRLDPASTRIELAVDSADHAMLLRVYISLWLIFHPPRVTQAQTTHCHRTIITNLLLEA